MPRDLLYKIHAWPNTSGYAPRRNRKSRGGGQLSHTLNSSYISNLFQNKVKGVVSVK